MEINKIKTYYWIYINLGLVLKDILKNNLFMLQNYVVNLQIELKKNMIYW